MFDHHLHAQTIPRLLDWTMSIRFSIHLIGSSRLSPYRTAQMLHCVKLQGVSQVHHATTSANMPGIHSLKYAISRDHL